jgi:gluconolactonase
MSISRRTSLGAIISCVVLCVVPLAISAKQGPAGPPSTGAGPAPGPGRGGGPPPTVALVGQPVASIDLTTAEGSALFNAHWKVKDVKIVEVPAVPSALPLTTTYDIDPHAGVAGFDDSSWPTIDAKGLTENRGGGKLSFMWYRTILTMPATVGTMDTTGMKAVLVVTVDDYTEVWINGQMPRAIGMPSPSTIQGWNVPSRIPITDAVKPGEKFEIAIFGINGPLSVAPNNRIWFREAAVEFFPEHFK